MSRLMEKRPEPSTKIFKISDDEHEIIHLDVKSLGKIKRTMEGWQIESGAKFDQEQDAIRQLYYEKNIEHTPHAREMKPKTKIIEVELGVRHIKLAGFIIDTQMMQFRDFKYYKTVQNGAKADLFAAKTKEQREKDEWIFLGSTDLNDK